MATSASATGSDVHTPRQSSAESAAHSTGHCSTTVDSLVYGVRPDDTEKVLKVLQHVSGALQMGSIACMLYNAACTAESSYQHACRCVGALLPRSFSFLHLQVPVAFGFQLPPCLKEMRRPQYLHPRKCYTDLDYSE